MPKAFRQGGYATYGTGKLLHSGSKGVFENEFDNQVVSFEAKREIVPSFQFPPIESLIAELDEKALEDMQKMFKSILAEIENMTEQSADLSFNGTPPKFDGEWYCP